jgi:hypothetical protein
MSSFGRAVCAMLKIDPRSSLKRSMIDTFKDAVFGAGEALILDNYHALHIREPCLDLDRRGWRREAYVAGKKCAGHHERTETSVQNILMPTVASNLETISVAEQSKL